MSVPASRSPPLLARPNRRGFFVCCAYESFSVSRDRLDGVLLEAVHAAPSGSKATGLRDRLACAVQLDLRYRSLLRAFAGKRRPVSVGVPG